MVIYGHVKIILTRDFNRYLIIIYYWFYLNINDTELIVFEQSFLTFYYTLYRYIVNCTIYMNTLEFTWPLRNVEG